MESFGIESRSQFAGFWIRFLALVIDYNLVLVALFPFFLLGGLLWPQHVQVEVPFGLFTDEQVIESSNESIHHADGSLTVIDESIIEETVLGRWVYHYKVTEERIANKTETERVLIEPLTHEPLDRYSRGDVVLYLLLLYWTLSESSRRRASLGKWIVGIEVVDEQGATLTWRRALGRNLGKILSAMVCMIGFMMAGWTDKKQGLHDKLARCLVVGRR